MDKEPIGSQREWLGRSREIEALLGISGLPKDYPYLAPPTTEAGYQERLDLLDIGLRAGQFERDRLLAERNAWKAEAIERREDEIEYKRLLGQKTDEEDRSA